MKYILLGITLLIISNQLNAQTTDAFKILPNGNVGIGTSTPTQAKLVVIGDEAYTGNLFIYGYNSSKSTSAPVKNSIYASNGITAQQLNVMSDQRIKNIIGVSNKESDLRILSKIEITDYKMIDSIRKGTQIYKKVIAQQVEKVYPTAVTSNLTEVIPNIYQLSDINKGWIRLSTKDLLAGDKIKLVFSKEEVLVNVLETDKDRIRVDCTKEGTVFVYGKEVHDFRTVDYESIAMLNVSATQALLKRIEALEAKELASGRTISKLKEEQIQTNNRLQTIEELILPKIANK